ncbi:general transcription factor II-I repeat domain-containing protein 2-like [Protopterus annectens]|uniref:general transcription factor II-I repeat domain-containing protein 2-like n=1 Tax=Protopterus annectens TaxID=7888 RepID=UPI001CFB0B8C|nr:general transcription factor II-I repeat domain-containing protein 2-like [Protopterus annectens]
MDQYAAKKLCDLIAKCEYFSLCLDESTDQADLSQLLIFVRTIQEDFTFNEELLSLVSLHGTTKGTDIFEAVQKSVMNYGRFDKCSCIVTDGAKAMTGTGSGFRGLLKQNNITCPTIHCIIHQEALCGKFLCQANPLKAIDLCHRKFRDFLSEMDAAYGGFALSF